MAEKAYHLVQTDKKEWVVFYGSERPKDIAQDEEARLKAMQEQWIPEGWKLVQTYRTRKEAEEARKESALRSDGKRTKTAQDPAGSKKKKPKAKAKVEESNAAVTNEEGLQNG
jgi:hypothetical protein